MVEETTWYIRYGVKGAGIFTALRMIVSIYYICTIVCFSAGVFSIISLSAGCIIAGLLLFIIGVIVIILEAPVCCVLVPQLNTFNEFTNARPPLQRAIFYAIMCFGISTIFSALALGCCCAINIWRIIKQKRQGQMPISTEYASQPDMHHGTLYSAPNPSGAPIGFRDQLVEKAAIGAVRGMMSNDVPIGGVNAPGTGYPSTNYYGP